MADTISTSLIRVLSCLSILFFTEDKGSGVIQQRDFYKWLSFEILQGRHSKCLVSKSLNLLHMIFFVFSPVKTKYQHEFRKTQFEPEMSKTWQLMCTKSCYRVNVIYLNSMTKWLLMLHVEGIFAASGKRNKMQHTCFYCMSCF